MVAAQVPPLRWPHLARPDPFGTRVAGPRPAGGQAPPRRAAPLPRPARPLGRVTGRRPAAKQGFKWSVHALDRLRPRPRGVTVLIYHRVGGRTPLDVDLPARRVRGADGGARRERAGPVDRRRARRARRSRPRRRRRPTRSSSRSTTAPPTSPSSRIPVLERHRIPATIYVATDFVDRGVDFPNDGRPLSWAALRDAAASGLVTVGSHTHTHALLDRLPAPAIADELDRADALIAEHVGRPGPALRVPEGGGGLVAGRRGGARAVPLGRARRDATRTPTAPPTRTASPARRSRRATACGSSRPRSRAACGFEDTLRDAANRWRYRGQVG